MVRVISRLIVGGPAWHVMQLAGLESRYPTLVVTGGIEPGEEDLLPEARARGLHVVRLPGLGRSVNPLRDAAGLARLVALLLATRPDIVHTHTAKAGALGRIAAAIARVPVRIHTFHGHVFEHYFGPAASRAVLWSERALGRLTTCVIAISERQASDLGDRFRIVPRSRLRVIPLGLDLERFGRTAPGEGRSFREELGAAGRPVLACVGRIVPIKRHDVLLDAFARLRATGVDAVLAVVGGGAGERALREHARSIGVETHVRFLGYRRDLERVYAGSDAVVLSSDAEGTPVSLIEAIAAGVPVVATAVGGVPELLGDGALGVLVPPRDPQALADALGEVLRDPGARAPDAAQRADIRARYGSARLLDDMTSLYDELCAPPGTRARLESPGEAAP